jgi:hypothetical protein
VYEPGRPENKPDVLKQLDEIKHQREEIMIEHQRKQLEYQDTINKVNQMYGEPGSQNIINQMSVIIQEVTMENKLLKDKVKYLEDKIRQIIREQVEKSKLNKLN